MSDFFTDLDDPLAYAEEMAKLSRSVQQKREVKYPKPRPTSSIPKRPARPVLASSQASTLEAAHKASNRGEGLPGSETLIYKPSTKMPSLDLARPKRPAKLEEQRMDVVVKEDGTRKYLKRSDTDAMSACQDLEWPTTRHIALMAGRSFGYFPRRLKGLGQELFCEQKTDSVGYPTWRLLERGHKYVGAQLPPVTSAPYDDKHFTRENINTLIAKLSVGVDESILYPKSPGYKLEPLPVVPKRWIEHSAKLLQKESKEKIARVRYDMLVSLLNDPTHPREEAWMSEDEIRKGVLPDERNALTNLYKNLPTAHVFTVLDNDGMPNLPFSPHFVILRPLVEGLRRADGRVEEYRFNHDACRVESDAYEAKDYQQLLFDLYHSGMFGRLHEFTNEYRIANALKDAWDWLIDGGYLPRFTDKHGHPIRSNDPGSWLQVRSLAEPLNNMGKGIDAYDEDMVQRARTYADG